MSRLLVEDRLSMPEEDLTTEEALRHLDELFRAQKDSVPTRRCRRYFLEFDSDKPVFRSTDSDSQPPRDEIELVLDQMIEEESGDDIVPQKLAKHFPGSPRTVRRY